MGRGEIGVHRYINARDTLTSMRDNANAQWTQLTPKSTIGATGATRSTSRPSEMLKCSDGDTETSPSEVRVAYWRIHTSRVGTLRKTLWASRLTTEGIWREEQHEGTVSSNLLAETPGVWVWDWKEEPVPVLDDSRFDSRGSFVYPTRLLAAREKQTVTRSKTVNPQTRRRKKRISAWARGKWYSGKGKRKKYHQRRSARDYTTLGGMALSSVDDNAREDSSKPAPEYPPEPTLEQLFSLIAPQVASTVEDEA